MFKFNNGQRVKIISNNLTGRVTIRFYNPATNTTNYTIKFDDLDLLPSEMNYQESMLEAYTTQSNSDSYKSSINDWRYKDVNNYCPKCFSKWSVSKSPVLDTEWKDCLKCNKTYEDIVGE